MFRNSLLPDVWTLRNTVDRLFNETVGSDQYPSVWSRGSNGSNGRALAQPMPLDVYSTEDEAVILAAIPGMQPENLDLSINQDTITLSGKVDSATGAEDAQGATWYLHELWSGEVRRSVTLPFPVDADQAQATFEHGILRVVLPKAETAKPRKIEISSKSGQHAIAAGKDKRR
jgi:HSP20 family protein